MAIWIIAKPRLRFNDAIDVFVGKLADVPSSRAFVMKPGYMATSAAVNHDDLFARFMGVGDEDRFVDDFLEILFSQNENSVFTPLVTNRLLTPILPRDIDPDSSSIRRRLRRRLDVTLENMSKRFSGRTLNCLIFAPDVVDLASSVRLGLLMEDGYTSARAENVVSRLIESIEFGEYKLRESGLFSDVHRIDIPTGASFAFIYRELRCHGAKLPNQVPVAWLEPSKVLDFYLIEALIPRSVRESLYSARPTSRSCIAQPFGPIVGSLIYTHRADREAGEMVLHQAKDGIIDFDALTVSESLSIDEYHRQSFLWRSPEVAS
jgi:hypothetical protein